MGLTFHKMQGTGNDFVVIDGRDQERGMQDAQWAELSKQMCDRHFGVGADGIIVAQLSKVAQVRMRMWNPDGSEAEMCGNGIRCLAKFAFEHGLVTSDEIAVETQSGIKPIKMRVENGRVRDVTVNMGAPTFEPERIPVLSQRKPVVDMPLLVGEAPITVSCVSMGNPHAVMFTNDDPYYFPLETIGRLVEHHQMFPKRVNFEVCKVEASDRLRVRVWERGAGITLACGTGACGTAVAARLHGYVGDECNVELPGGTLAISWAGGNADVFMTGPAETVFCGTWLDAGAR